MIKKEKNVKKEQDPKGTYRWPVNIFSGYLNRTPVVMF